MYKISRITTEIRVFTALVMKMIHRDREERLARIFPGRTGVQLGVLQILRNQPYTLSEISNFMQLSPPTLVPVIDRLEKEKLIERRQDGKDRRRNHLVINRKGLDFLRETDALDLDNLLINSLAVMDEQDIQKLNQLLQTLVTRMSTDTNLVQQVLNNLDYLELGKEKAENEQ